MADQTVYIGNLIPQGPVGPQGPKGDKGDKGDRGVDGVIGHNGYTFTPFVSTTGDLTWTKTQDEGGKIPDPINIKGPKGDKGDDGAQGPAGPTGPEGPRGPGGLTTTNATTLNNKSANEIISEARQGYATQSWVKDTAVAHDSSLLNGQNSSYYLNYNNLTNKPNFIPFSKQSGVNFNSMLPMGFFAGYTNGSAHPDYGVTGDYNVFNIPTFSANRKGYWFQTQLVFHNNSTLEIRHVEDRTDNGGHFSIGPTYTLLTTEHLKYEQNNKNYPVQKTSQGLYVTVPWEKSDLTGYATEDWVTKQKYLTVIPSEYITENELTAKNYITNTKDAFSYSNLSGQPKIPTDNKELNNGAGYITSADIPNDEIIFSPTPSSEGQILRSIIIDGQKWVLAGLDNKIGVTYEEI